LKKENARYGRADALKNALLLQPNGIVRRLYRKALWSLPRNDRAVYLTFDDGPIPGITEWVLDQLNETGAKATFFCVGENILKHPAIFDRIRIEGHSVANHTMHHTKGFRSNLRNYLRDIEDCARLVENNLFRPPYGQLKRSQYRALVERGYRIVLWDVISYDYEHISEKKCVSNVLKNTRNGSIVLFHDNIKAEKNLRYSLPLVLKELTSQGFTFRAL
jgi:peptidoglycan-N-acetylglucosamine deacetylase